MQKLLRMFRLPTVWMPRPGIYFRRVQFQCDDAMTSWPRSVWHADQAAVTSRPDVNDCWSAASFE